MKEWEKRWGGNKENGVGGQNGKKKTTTKKKFENNNTLFEDQNGARWGVYTEISINIGSISQSERYFPGYYQLHWGISIFMSNFESKKTNPKIKKTMC
jgi:hypothetical protein